MQKWLAVLCIGLCSVGHAFAQVLTPITKQPVSFSDQPHTAKATGEPAPLADEDPISLPFFDDFSKAEGNPDPARWLSKGGVLTSNRFAANSRTVSAATFDGLKANGEPYGGISSVGPTDTLTSRPLLLGHLQPQDSVYLSFFWQAGGLLDAPNFSSANLYYLALEFKEASGVWTQVWSQQGNGRSTDFAAVMLALKEAKYLHDNFQFRFVSSGSQSAMRDVWHLDYVVLDKNRRKGQLQTLDVALTKHIPSLLRRFTAMPYWQFMLNPAAELRTDVGSELVNLSGVPAAISWRAYTKNLSTGAADTFLTGSAAINPGTRRTIAAAPSVDFIRNQNGPFSLQTSLFLSTKEPNFFTRYNDTLTRRTDIQNFYAYDDGTAETGFSYPSSNTVQIAYQFEVTQPDKVKQVMMYFTGTNTPGTELYLRVWTDNGGKPSDQPVHEQRFLVPATLNEWLNVELTTPIEVQGRFYIGFRQPGGSAFVNVGFDFQENAVEKIFAINGPGDWSTISGFAGALMMRPVMTGLLTSVEPELAESKPFLYPNPATDFVTIGQKLNRLELYSLTGQKLRVWENLTAGARLEIGGLPAGVYLVKAFNGTQFRTTKLILQP
ncbi:T9SS type A sorting domain-containing protein [Rufibacter roseus]|uniref:T9SS type A sorting domain-containing protein n=1 Tax=Rufibacter roseus TaxID=1567108 RepID=A0ABW2DK04_9BACT|nr:T9SS type A sorting domain-containing protein [Rufibacter roseus]